MSGVPRPDLLGLCLYMSVSVCRYVCVPTTTHETAAWHGRHRHIRARLKSRRENMEPQGAYKKYKRLWGGGRGLLPQRHALTARISSCVCPGQCVCVFTNTCKQKSLVTCSFAEDAPPLSHTQSLSLSFSLSSSDLARIACNHPCRC